MTPLKFVANANFKKNWNAGVTLLPPPPQSHSPPQPLPAYTHTSFSAFPKENTCKKFYQSKNFTLPLIHHCVYSHVVCVSNPSVPIPTAENEFTSKLNFISQRPTNDLTTTSYSSVIVIPLSVKTQMIQGLPLNLSIE